VRRSVPERPIRVILLLAACAPGPLVLGAIDSGLDNWQHPLPWSLAILVAALLLLRGELHPALLDEEPARRAARYSLFVPPLLLITAVLFPHTISWALLWALSLVLLYLLAFAYVPRVRVAALAVSSTLSFGLVLLDPSMAWVLAAPGVAWFALPALETSARARLALTNASQPRLIWPLSGILACLSVGVGVFTAAALLLPSAQADYRQTGLLKTAGSAPILPPGPPPSVPWLELGALVVIVVVTVVLFARFLAGSRRDAQQEPDLPHDVTLLGKRSRSPRATRPRSTRWEASPRLALIERYLQHLSRLGLDPAPEDTPAKLLEGLPEEERARARLLAERFERARWSPQPVEAKDLSAAEAEASAIEAALAEAQDPK
jgi:uncharacterized protein DUF4129